VTKVADFPPSDGCALCRGWTAVSPRDAVGAGMRVEYPKPERWVAYCSRCNRMVGRGVRVPGRDVGWSDRPLRAPAKK
jgi:hypothetical protein